MLLWNQGRTIAKTVDQGKIQGLPLLCPIRLHCCTNYNAPTGALDSKAARSLLESMLGMNENYGATILMVTHDAFAASFASRVIFLKDGKVYSEVHKGNDTRKQFFDKIIDVVTLLGAQMED